ncbi:MAG: DUF5056 domain-containing protein [Bacteroidaceae bacterium]|nr:DUF5056 domain-containing protein [Bacteroidaceae bacterium]
MTDNDKLLKQFLIQNQKPIEDNGFTEGVMRRIPSQRKDYRIMFVWTLIGIIGALVPLILFGANLNLEGVFSDLIPSKLSLESLLKVENLKYVIGFVVLYFLCVVEGLNYMRSNLPDDRWTIQ